jgi:hypothetical protein
MSALYISPTKFGKGLFANRKFKKNEKICPVYGPLVHQSELPSEMYEEADRYVQIGLDLYIGPSYDFSQNFSQNSMMMTSNRHDDSSREYKAENDKGYKSILEKKKIEEIQFNEVLDLELNSMKQEIEKKSF